MRRAKPLRVLMAPAPTFDPSNAYLRLLATNLERDGVRIEALTAGNILRLRPDVVHVHWPDAAAALPRWRSATYGCAKRLAYLQLSRLLGARIVWTAHNLRGHDVQHPQVERWFWIGFSRQVDVVLSLTESGLDDLWATYPRLRRTPTVVTRHGSYAGAYGPTGNATTARRGLDVPPRATVVGFFGQIRPYKGVTELITAFKEMAGPGRHLLIAGRANDENLSASISHEALQRDDITYRPGFIPDAELSTMLAASDLVVLPYRQVFNSGSALLALSYRRPVLVPDTPVFRELRTDVGDQWVHLFTGDLTASALAAAVEQPPPTGSTPDLSRHSWPTITRQTAQAYEGPLRQCG